jgi:arsenate reductase
MAAAFFNALADARRAYAISAGTRPGERVHPAVVEAMREIGIDLSTATPQGLSAALAKGATDLITMGCGEECPAVPGSRRDVWPIEDPKDQPVERVRLIREEIRRRVVQLIDDRSWGPGAGASR